MNLVSPLLINSTQVTAGETAYTLSDCSKWRDLELDQLVEND